MRKLLEENPDDFLNYLKECKEKRCENKGQTIKEFLGSFNTELEAFNAYKIAKESFVKEQANKWKVQIDKRAYEALMKYEVNIDD